MEKTESSKIKLTKNPTKLSSQDFSIQTLPFFQFLAPMSSSRNDEVNHSVRP